MNMDVTIPENSVVPRTQETVTGLGLTIQLLRQEGTDSGTSSGVTGETFNDSSPRLCHALLESSEVPVAIRALLRFKLLDINHYWR